MFRKILFLLLLVSVGVSAQRVGPEYECFDLQVHNISSDQKFIKEGDNYLVCKNQTITPIPSLEVNYLNKTDRYQIEQIPFNPYPLTGGIEVDVMDDERSRAIPLPFRFCFFDKVYDKVFVWSNGIVTFYDGPGDGGNGPRDSYPPAGGMPAMPNFYYASIFGSYQHTHWNRFDFDYGSINYRVEGTYPCRKFIVSFHDMPPYGLNVTTTCPPSVPRQSHQIVLYETLNVIDVNIIDHKSCPANVPYDASAVIGIIDHTGGTWYNPTGRAFGPWDAYRESWRFAPSGDPLWDVEWTVDGQPSKDGTTIIDKTKVIKGCLVVKNCAKPYPDQHRVCWQITVEPAIDIDKLDLEYIVCDKNQNEYDLNLISQAIKNEQSTEKGKEILNFLYYPTYDDAMNKTNEINNIKKFPIKGKVNEVTKNLVFARVEIKGLDDCFEILPATIIKAPVEVIFKPDVNLCEEYILPELLDKDEFYYKLDRLDEDGNFAVENLPVPEENQLIDRVGYYRVYVKRVNEYKCEDIKSYILFVESCSFPKGISPNGDGANDYLDLTYNNVKELKIYNRHGKLVYKHGKGYKRQWGGQDSKGSQLPSGTYFMYVKTKDSEYQDWIQLMYEVK